MNFKMAPSSAVGFRIVVDLSEIYSTTNPIYNRCWCFVPFKDVQSIKHLRKHIRRRFNIPRSVLFTLMLDGYALWHDEPIHVLRDSDIVLVRKTHLESDEQNDILAESETLSAKTETFTSHETVRQFENGKDLNETHKKRKKRSHKYSPSSEQVSTIQNGCVEEPVLDQISLQNTDDVTSSIKRPKLFSPSDWNVQSSGIVEIKANKEIANAQDSEKAPLQSQPGRRRKRSRSRANKQLDNSQLNHVLPSKPVSSRWTTSLQSKSPSQSRHIRFDYDSALGPQPSLPKEQFHSTDTSHQTAGEDNEVNAALSEEVQVAGQEISCDSKSEAKDSEALQNSDTTTTPAEPECKDYSLLPALVGPPRVGDRIAFQELELSESYTPEVSEFREGVVQTVDLALGSVHLKFSKAIRVATIGKFSLEDVDEENPGFQLVTQKTLLLSEMLNPKLF